VTQEEIINGSKLIAEYLGWKYIPFNDLQDFSKAGWYKTIDAKPNMKEVTLTSYKHGEESKAIVKTITVDINRFKYNQKSGWTLIGDKYYKYICRKHSDLKFWNSIDTLVPLIQKIEQEYRVSFFLSDSGCSCGYGLHQNDLYNEISSYDLPDWSNNVFKVIVEYLEKNKHER